MWQTPYGPVLRAPSVRRLLPGLVASSIGDGMSVVAVAWLAVELAPPRAAGTWVAICSAAAVVPGLVVAVLAAGPLGRLPAVRLGQADAWLRAVTLGGVPVTAVLGLLSIHVLAALLAVSSLLHPWGVAGRYTLVADVLPAHRIAGNAMLSGVAQVGVLVGPALAAVVISSAGAVGAVAVDAATFVVLALAYRAAKGPWAAATAAERAEDVEGASDHRPAPDRHGAGVTDVFRQPTTAAILVISFALFALYGPVEVALPVLVALEQRAAASLLSAYVVAFGVGALTGSLFAGWLGRVPPGPLTAAIIIGWGACLLPLGLDAPRAVSVAAFGLGAFIYAPYVAVTTGLIQRVAPPRLLTRVLALRTALLGFSVPLGAVAAGPLLGRYGATRVILASAVGTIGLGCACALACVWVRRAVRPR